MRPRGRFLGVAALGVYAFLYLPIFALVAFSFNRSRLNARWTGFTLDWYVKAFGDKDIQSALGRSALIAFCSTLVATAIGTLGAYALERYRFSGKRAVEGALHLPIVIPEVVAGVSLLLLFAYVDLPLGFTSILLAHVTFSLPFVVVVTRARLAGFDWKLTEAATDLGASSLQTFVRVTLPLMMPGVIAAALLAFTLSIDDFVITYFVSGPGTTTLPLQIYSMVRFGVSPEINALSTAVLLVTVALAVVSQHLLDSDPA